MDWLAFSLALLRLLAGLLTWLREKELIDEGARIQIANALAQQAKDMAVAKAVDDRVDAALERGQLPDLKSKWTRPGNSGGDVLRDRPADHP